MEAMGWVNDSANKQYRDLGMSDLSVQLTVFNDGNTPITLPTLILNNVAILNSALSPTLVLTYTPWELMTLEKKNYPIVPSKEAFFPVKIKPGEAAYVKMEGTTSWLKAPNSNPNTVIFRTTGFLSERLGFSPVDLKSALQIVDQRERPRPITVSPTSDSQWLRVNEGFEFLIPSDWKDQEARGIDSHVGKYGGRSAYLEFDELFGLGYTVEKSQKAADDLAKKEANPKLLQPGEEVWRLDGRIALFSSAKVDPKVFGDREHGNVASLFVPYGGKAGYLSVHLFYADENYLPTARKVLHSFTWPKKSPQTKR